MKKTNIGLLYMVVFLIGLLIYIISIKSTTNDSLKEKFTNDSIMNINNLDTVIIQLDSGNVFKAEKYFNLINVDTLQYDIFNDSIMMIYKESNNRIEYWKSKLNLDSTIYFFKKRDYTKSNIHLNKILSKSFNNECIKYRTKIDLELKKINSTKINSEFNNLYNEYKNQTFNSISSLNYGFIYWNDKKIKNHKNYTYRNNIVLKNFRQEWFKIIKNDMWKDDFDFQILGNNLDILVIAHHTIISNSAKQEYYNIFIDRLRELGFKQLRLKWFIEDSEYTYYTIN